MRHIQLCQQYRFEKEPVPDNPDEKLKMVERLRTLGVSITQYEKAYKMPDISYVSILLSCNISL